MRRRKEGLYLKHFDFKRLSERTAGHGVHLSPRIHQEYIFRHRSACRTLAESGQEYLTRGQEYIESCKSRYQALSPWSRRTDSKTLDYQRTNPRGYQIVRTHTKETTWIKDPATSSTLCRMPHSNNKQEKTQTKSSADRITTSLSLAHKRKNKQTNNLAQISPYTKLTQTTGPILGGQKPKGRKNSTLKAGKSRPQTQ